MAEGSVKKKNFLVPEPALRRMPCYLAYLKLEHRRGSKYVSSTLIAKDNGVDPTQVTKDLSYTGISGKTRWIRLFFLEQGVWEPHYYTTMVWFSMD